jgi:hypothetical protein
MKIVHKKKLVLLTVPKGLNGNCTQNSITVVLDFVYNTVRSSFECQTHHLSALQLSGKET